ASALQVAQVAHGPFGFFREPHQALRVVQEDAPGLRELAVFRRSIEEPFAEVLLEPADCLADSRLCPMQPRRGPGEAALGGDRQEELEFSEIHASLGAEARNRHILSIYGFVMIINLTNG